MRADAVEDQNDGSHGHLHSIQTEQQLAHVPRGQTPHRAQGGDPTAQPHAKTSLLKNLGMDLHGGLMPLLTLGAPALENPMVCQAGEAHRSSLAHAPG
jgi:hypothetical protein